MELVSIIVPTLFIVCILRGQWNEHHVRDELCLLAKIDNLKVRSNRKIHNADITWDS